jgi:hypothetical protein
MTGRTRRYLLPGLFILILFNLAASGFFQVYWLKENQYSLEPQDVNIRWLSDTDYRALQSSTASRYTAPDGHTFEIPPRSDDRKALLSRFQIVTPDGRWHGLISTRLAAHTLGVWLAVAVPVFAISVVGLVVSLPGRHPKDSSDPLADAGTT